jgi:hypothetical protein
MESIDLTRSATGDMFAGTYPVYEYTAYFTAPVTVTEGWFSIQSMVGTAVDCWNLALNQPGGAGNCLQYDGSSWTPQDEPIGFCLIGDEFNPWLSVDPTSGSVSGGDFDEINVTVNTAGFPWDAIYEASIWAASNDPVNPLVEIPVTLQCPTGISDVEDAYIMMYPNPAKTVVNISTNFDLSKVSILNQLGQVVLEQEVSGNAVALQTSHLQKGIYFVKINSEAGESIQKLVIQ